MEIDACDLGITLQRWSARRREFRRVSSLPRPESRGGGEGAQAEAAAVLVGGGHDRERLPGGALAETGTQRSGERRRQERADSAKRVGRERNGSGTAVAADCAAGGRKVADEP